MPTVWSSTKEDLRIFYFNQCSLQMSWFNMFGKTGLKWLHVIDTAHLIPPELSLPVKPMKTSHTNDTLLLELSRTSFYYLSTAQQLVFCSPTAQFPETFHAFTCGWLLLGSSTSQLWNWLLIGVDSFFSPLLLICQN